LLARTGVKRLLKNSPSAPFDKLRVNGGNPEEIGDVVEFVNFHLSEGARMDCNGIRDLNKKR
jgi:hypothetical protein